MHRLEQDDSASTPSVSIYSNGSEVAVNDMRIRKKYVVNCLKIIDMEERNVGFLLSGYLLGR